MPRPKPESYPKVLKTIGDYIRAWRIDNHLSQEDVATLLSVCEDTIVGWEMRRRSPSIRYMPGIIKMLGYIPVKINASTFGGQIKQFRYLNGLTPKEFGHQINTNSSTILNWEKGINKPLNKKRKMVESIIEH